MRDSRGYRLMIDANKQWLQDNPDADESVKSEINKKIKTYTFLAEIDKEMLYDLVASQSFSKIMKGYILKLIDSVDMAKRTRISLIYQMEQIMSKTTPAEAEEYYKDFTE